MPLLTSLLNVFNTIVCLLPTSNCPTTQNVTYYQWTQTGRIQLPADYSTLRSNASTYAIVHGWTENSFVGAYELIAANYLTLDPRANIILVDYGSMSNDSYLEAQQIVDIVGTAFGNKAVDMLRKQVISIKRVQMFGHSLGTHVAGKAARIILNELDARIARISASDPAGPLFRFPLGLGALSDPLTKQDADVLDITHSSYTAGTWESFGSIDTYVSFVNGHQPACLNANTSSVGQVVDFVLFCDHRMARAYFAESILSCGFRQMRMRDAMMAAMMPTSEQNDTIIYGQHMPLNATGIYVMSVNGNPPYAKGENSFPDC